MQPLALQYPSICVSAEFGVGQATIKHDVPPEEMDLSKVGFVLCEVAPPETNVLHPALPYRTRDRPSRLVFPLCGRCKLKGGGGAALHAVERGVPCFRRGGPRAGAVSAQRRGQETAWRVVGD